MTPKIQQLLAQLEQEADKEKILFMALTAKPDSSGDLTEDTTSNASPDSEVDLLLQWADYVKNKKAQKRKTTEAQNHKPSIIH